MSLCSEAARPFVVACVVDDAATTVVTTVDDGDGAESPLGTTVVLEDSLADVDEAGVVEAWDDTVELIDSSSCKFFSYSVCFPCCISSFVKLAASSPKKSKLYPLFPTKFFHLPSSWRYMQSCFGQGMFFIKCEQYLVVPRDALRVRPSATTLLTA